MAALQVDLCGKASGAIWTKKPTADSKIGLLLEVSNTKLGLTSQGRRMLFVKVSFGLHGNWFVAGDQLGNIYLFDLNRNRFKLILKAKQACTGLACCIARPNEVLVALADYSIKCVDLDSSSVVATLTGHEACVHTFSQHSSGRYVLGVSSRDTILWDLDTFTRRRTLNGGQEVGVQDDDSIHAWDATDLDYKYQIPPPFGPTPRYRSFASPQDGRLLVGGGRSEFLHVWGMESRQLQRIVQLPSVVRHVRQLVFLPDMFDGGSSETLGCLAQDGVMRFININSCKQLFHIGSQDKMVSCVQAGPTGRYLVAVSETGRILLYDVATLTKHLRQPPSSLVMLEDRPSTSHIKPVKVSETRTSSSAPTPGHRRAPADSHQRSRSPKTQNKVTLLVPQENDGGVANRDDGADESCLDKEKLLSVLVGYGEYPAKYRMFIWRHFLELPENHSAYSSLLEKGTHPSYAALHQQYPMKSRKLLRVLQRALSALAHWAPIFGEVEYLPGLVFPFVKMFQNNQLVTFEFLATILMNWCGQWFEYFPNPPLNVLAMAENLLAHHDPHLLQHFVRLGVTSQMYAWPLLETLFSEVLSKGEWLRVWDNIISHPPGYILLVLVAYLTTARNTLFKCTQQEDFEYFFRHQNTVDIGGVVKEANLMRQTTPPEIHPEELLGSFVPLTRETYPVFNKYPKFIVDYHVKERQRIRKEELDYLRERQSALELERMMEQRKEEERAWYRQQQLLMDAEDQRRKMVEAEDKKLADQRTRLQALKRELKVKELHVLDATRRRFLGHQQHVREAELRSLDQQMQRKVVAREKETQAVLTDLETRTIELERQKALLEGELRHCQEEMRQRLRAEASSELHSVELEKSMLEQAVEEDAHRERQRLDHAHAKLAKMQAQRANVAATQEAAARRSLREIQRDVKLEEVAEKAQLNHLQEKKVEMLLGKLEKDTKALMKSDTDVSSGTFTTPPGSTLVVGQGAGASGGGAGAMGVASKEPTLGGRTLLQLRQEASGLSKDTFVTAETSGSFYQTVPSNRDTFVSARTSGSFYETPPSENPPPTDSNNAHESGLLWSSRRQLLDQQEAVMMARIRELRERVASQMSSTAGSRDHHVTEASGLLNASRMGVADQASPSPGPHGTHRHVTIGHMHTQTHAQSHGHMQHQ